MFEKRISFRTLVVLSLVFALITAQFAPAVRAQDSCYICGLVRSGQAGQQQRGNWNPANVSPEYLPPSRITERWSESVPTPTATPYLPVIIKGFNPPAGASLQWNVDVSEFNNNTRFYIVLSSAAASSEIWTAAGYLASPVGLVLVAGTGVVYAYLYRDQIADALITTYEALRTLTSKVDWSHITNHPRGEETTLRKQGVLDTCIEATNNGSPPDYCGTRDRDGSRIYIWYGLEWGEYIGLAVIINSAVPTVLWNISQAWDGLPKQKNCREFRPRDGDPCNFLDDLRRSGYAF